MDHTVWSIRNDPYGIYIFLQIGGILYRVRYKKILYNAAFWYMHGPRSVDIFQDYKFLLQNLTQNWSVKLSVHQVEAINYSIQ